MKLNIKVIRNYARQYPPISPLVNEGLRGVYHTGFLILFIFILLFSNTVYSQQSAVITGWIVDEGNNPVTGANIFIRGTVLGTASGNDGKFKIESVPEGEFVLSVSVIGYREKDVSLQIKNGQALDLGIIKLTATPLQSQPIVVTAGKYEQKLENVPASMSNIPKAEIEDRNSTTIDKALQYVSGINMNLDQVNIRGSSGYSKGVGSRVMMLVDGVPYIAGDTQGMIFEAMPMNQIERIEIVKGAGSALYGSSAIGGVINVITRPINEEPELGLQMYCGLYSDPYYEQWRWSEKSRFLHGVKANYSQKFGKTGLRLAASRDVDDSHRRNDWKERYNIGGKLEFDLTPFDRLTISGNYMDQKRGNFFYWKDLSNALVPPDEQLSERVHSVRYYLSPVYNKILTKSSYYKISAIWFHNSFDDNIGETGNNSDSDYLNAEFQYNKESGIHLFTAGLTPTYNTVTSNIFGSRKGIGAAAFIQDEIKWSEKWITTIGGRFDYYDIDSLGSDNSVNPKLGIIFKPAAGMALRASAGTGFRAPSMAEAFTSTSTGGLIVIPNVNLKAERSASAELGWRQVFSAYMATDLAVFYNRYWDLIEGGFLPSGNIQFQNVTEAQISGIEANLFLQPLPKKLFFNLGYTYMDPRNLTIKEYLNYRPRHLLYAQAKWNISVFTAGVDYRFMSKYDRIDENFALIIPDAEALVDAHIVDLRLSAQLKLADLPLSVSIQVNNLLQYHYTDLIGSIAPIRNYVLTVDIRF